MRVVAPLGEGASLPCVRRRVRGRLEADERCQRHHAHQLIRVIEPGDHGIGVLRQRRRFQIEQRVHCACAHSRVGVVEPREHGIGVLRQRRRLKMADHS